MRRGSEEGVGRFERSKMVERKGKNISILQSFYSCSNSMWATKGEDRVVRVEW
jgi:hypothetical protein